MSLTAGTGPLGPDAAGAFDPPVPPGVVYVEPHLRRVRGVLRGRTVVDSERVLLVHRCGQPPVYAFPVTDVDAEAPSFAQPQVAGHVSIEWSHLDSWFEEDAQVQGYHPRSPYHRIDCVPSSRRLRVTIDGVVLVDTANTTVVFETSVTPRLYVSPADVRMDLLRANLRTSFCGYKGTAHYWDAELGGRTVDDVAWSYERTFPESSPITGYLSFDTDLAQVDGDLPVPRRWPAG